MKSLPFNNPKISYLAKLAKGWKGQLLKLSKVDFKKLDWAEDVDDGEWSLAPFSYKGEMGINFKSKTIVYYGDIPWPYLIHEMGHVFATTMEPEGCKEEDFYGWEFAIGRDLGLDEWIKHNADYVIELENGKLVPVGKLSKETVLKEMERFLRQAKVCGLVTRRGTLKTLRGSCQRCHF